VAATRSQIAHALLIQFKFIHHKPLMMHGETTAFFLRTLEFIKTWISPKMMGASR